jgi:GNAT superfamily N-acetyltransferase
MGDLSEFFPLLWDSDHFGFPVAALAAGCQNPATALARAKVAGIRLVYWEAQPTTSISPSALEDYRGVVVARKVIFGKTLEASTALQPSTKPALIDHYTHKVATNEMVTLAIQAGRHSRFQVDPRISRPAFESLYTKWINSSVSGQMADTVFVAKDSLTGGICGLITLKAQPGSARIGLIAVSPEHQGKGYGKALMVAGEAWARTNGAKQLLVCTQLENQQACQLYGASGFSVKETLTSYHFWPLP